jgi:hypothetical protein
MKCLSEFEQTIKCAVLTKNDQVLPNKYHTERPVIVKKIVTIAANVKI